LGLRGIKGLEIELYSVLKSLRNIFAMHELALHVIQYELGVEHKVTPLLV